MEITKQINLIVKQRKEQEVAKKEEYNSLCKKRLADILKTKFKTVFIGSISEIEKTFGKLWGYGKKQEDLTEEEKKWFSIWVELRNRVLNNGNNQIRGMESELERHTVTWNRYNKVFKAGDNRTDEPSSYCLEETGE